MQAFFGSRISPNLSRTPEGFLVAHRVPLGRTGWMDYAPSELGVTSNSPIVKVYRDAEDLFSTATMASFEGKDVTDGHPSSFVSPDSYSFISRGHIQNVRRGESCPEGEMLIGDLVVKDGTLISKVEGGLRETSSGYNFRLYCYDCKKPITPNNEGDDICSCDDSNRMYQQRQILGNHTALVPRGRAGPSVCISDSAEAIEDLRHLGTEEPKASGVEAANQRKDRMKKRTPKEWAQHIIGLGLKTFAKDAEPDELAEAASATKDAESEAVERNEEFNKEALRRTAERGKDEEPMSKEDEHVPGCRCDDCLSEKPTLKVVHDGIKGLSEMLKAKQEEKPAASKDAAPDSDEDDWKKEMNDWRGGIDASMKTIHDGLSELLKRKEEGEAAPKEEVPLVATEEKSKDDADLIEELPKEDLPENPIPGADSANVIANLKALKPWYANPANFPDRKAHDAAIKGFNAQMRIAQGRATEADRSYADMNNPKRPEAVKGQDQQAPATPEKIGADFVAAAKASGAAMRRPYNHNKENR